MIAPAAAFPRTDWYNMEIARFALRLGCHSLLDRGVPKICMGPALGMQMILDSCSPLKPDHLGCPKNRRCCLTSRALFNVTSRALVPECEWKMKEKCDALLAQKRLVSASPSSISTRVDRAATRCHRSGGAQLSSLSEATSRFFGD